MGQETKDNTFGVISEDGRNGRVTAAFFDLLTTFATRLQDTSLASGATYKSVHLGGVDKPSGLWGAESQPGRPSPWLTPRRIGGSTI